MSFAEVVERLQKLENPYPGLRPFETEESHLFFGRDQQVAELVGRLERNRFVAVLGVSGSGKSSLVRAGLIPALERGRVSEAGQRWRIVVTRPAGAPFQSLARNLGEAGLDASGLSQTSHGLIEVARQLEADESLLVVIDQFEELFRYKGFAPMTEEGRRAHDAAAANAAEFVQLLMAARNHHPPVYIVITMRSDYLGECAEFRDLPETLNDCQYLVPRMTRDQRKAMIEGPLGRVQIAPSLVQRLLNDAGDEPDQLPILQHALMRTWNQWRADDPDRTRRIDLSEYAAIGGFDEALNRHADELLAGVPENIAATIFKRLTARGTGNRERRDPARLGELWALCGAVSEESRAAVTSVVDHFRRGEATFLTPRAGAVDRETYIDITHESLIRQWKKLHDEWLPEEERSARTFLDLVVRAGNWKSQRGEVLIGLDFAGALDWDRQRNTSGAWAEHYASKADLDAVVALIDASKQEERRRQFRVKRNFSLAVTLALVFAGLGALAWYKKNEADQLKTKSIVRQLAAESSALQAESINLEPAVNLAIASMRTLPSLEGDRALRESSERLPRRVSKFTHGAAVSAVAFSANGEWLATGSEDKTARVFDVAAGKQISELKHGGGVASVAFSPDGRHVATGSDDGTARVFEATTGKQIAELKHGASVASVAFSPDGRWVATASADRTARVFEAAGGRQVSALKQLGEVTSVAFSPDGRRVATGSEDNTARVFDAGSGKEVFRVVHGGPVWSVAFSPDGRRLATGSHDATARVFDANSGKELFSVAHNAAVISVAFSGDGQFVATGSEDKTARVFDVVTGREVSRLTVRDPIESVAFSKDGRWVAAGADDMSARLFEAASGKEVTRFAHDGAVAAVAFSPDGKRVATGSADGTARTFELSGGMEIVRLSHASVVLVTALIPDGKLVATGTSDQMAQLFDAVTGATILRLPQQGSVGGVAVSPDGRLIATGSSDRLARVFDASTGQEVSRLLHDKQVVSVSFSPDSRQVVTGSWDKTARVFDAASGKEVVRLSHDGTVNSAVFSADGRWVATASEDKRARVFDVTTGKEVSELAHDGAVTFAAFSPDGRLVATAAEDNTARVFDRADGHQISSLNHARAVRFVAFSPDGRRVASGGDDGTARVFDAMTGAEISRIALDGRVLETRFIDQGRYLLTVSHSTSDSQVVVSRVFTQPGDVIDEACSRLTRSFSPAEWKRYVGSDEPFSETCPHSR